MQYLLKNHTGLDSVERIYSFLAHLEKTTGKDLGTLLLENNTYPCFKKISNKKFYEMLADTGKATNTFLSHYDSVEKISTRALFNPTALKNYLLKKGLKEEGVDLLINYFVSLYVYENEEAKKELYFLILNNNKKVSGNLFMSEDLPIEDEFKNFILFKDKEDEDGKIPIPNIDGADLLERISRKTVILDLGKQAEIQEIIDAQMELCEDEDAIIAFKNIAKIIGLVII